MQCRICLEGPEGHNNPLRLRCLCKTCPFHDACLIKWLFHKYRENVRENHDHDYNYYHESEYNIIPTCEICKSPFRGVVIKTKIYSIKPGLYCARLVAGMHWILAMVILNFIHTYYSEKPDCSNKKNIVYFEIMCRYFSFLTEVFFSFVHIIISCNWARICYHHQLQKFPRNWIVQVKTRQIVLSPIFLSGVNIPKQFSAYEKYKSFVKIMFELNNHIMFQLQHMQNMHVRNNIDLDNV